MSSIASLCPVCHGTGWIATESDDPYGRYIPDWERCPACKGKLRPKGAEEYTGSVPLPGLWERLEEDRKFWEALGRTCAKIVADGVAAYIKEDAAQKAPALTGGKEGKEPDEGEV